MFAEAKDAFTLSDVREPTLSLSERPPAVTKSLFPVTNSERGL
jgi:hypothetical protein